MISGRVSPAMDSVAERRTAGAECAVQWKLAIEPVGGVASVDRQ
jgi:hypothetical protein